MSYTDSYTGGFQRGPYTRPAELHDTPTIEREGSYTDSYTSYTEQGATRLPTSLERWQACPGANSGASIKTYRRHRCARQHRTVRAFLRCAIPTVEWIHGTGDFALIAWCSSPTITLWTTEVEALAALENLGPCGGRCTGRHEVVRLAYPTQPTTTTKGTRP